MNATSADPNREARTRLLELATQRGFTFTPAKEGRSWWGERAGPQWHDVIFLDASGPSNAVRFRRDHRAPDEPLFIARVTGTALTVLYTVMHAWPPPD